MAVTSPSNSASPAAATVPSLVPQGQHLGKPALPLGRPFTLVGSRHRAHLHLLSRSVSKSHAAIIGTDSGLYVRDLASREHVFVNGVPVKEADLKNGDLLQIGTFTFKYSDPAARSRPRAGSRAVEAVMQVEGSNIPLPIEGRAIVIGRRPTCDISLVELSASTIHAIIFEVDGQRYIRDLGSRTGTFVNGRPIHHHPLQLNDRIKIGETEMRYVAAGAAPGAEDDLDHIFGSAATAPVGVTDEGPLDLDDLDDLEPQPLATPSPAFTAAPTPATAPMPAAHEEPEPSAAAREAARRALEQVNRAALEQQDAHPAPVPVHHDEAAPIPIATEDDDLIPLASETPAAPTLTSSPSPVEDDEPIIPIRADEAASTHPEAETASIPLEPVDLDDLLGVSPEHDADAIAPKQVDESSAVTSSISALQPAEPEPKDFASQSDADPSTADKLDLDIWSDEPKEEAPSTEFVPAEASSVAFAPDAAFTTDAGTVADVERDELTVYAEPNEPAPTSEVEGRIEPPKAARPDVSFEHAEPERPKTADDEQFAPAENETPAAEPVPSDATATATAEAPIIEPEPITTATKPEVRAPELPLEIELPPVPVDPAAAASAILGGTVALPGKKKPPRKKREPKAPAAKPVIKAPPKAPPARGGRGRKKTLTGAEPVVETPGIESPATPAAPIEAEPLERVAPEVEAPFSEAPLPKAPPIEEILAPTEPVPESAQVLDPGILETDEPAIETEPMLAVPADEEAADALALSDTRFGHVVEEFAGAELGPLVEDRREEPELEISADQPAETRAEAPGIEEPAVEPEAEVAAEQDVSEQAISEAIEEEYVGTAHDAIDIAPPVEIVPASEASESAESFYEAERAPEWVAHLPAAEPIVEVPPAVPAAEAAPVAELSHPATEIEPPDRVVPDIADVVVEQFVAEPASDSTSNRLGAALALENDALVEEATAFLAHEEPGQPPLPAVDEVIAAPASADAIELAESIDSSVVPLEPAVEAIAPGDSLLGSEAPTELAAPPGLEFEREPEPEPEPDESELAEVEHAAFGSDEDAPLASLEDLELELAPEDRDEPQAAAHGALALSKDESGADIAPLELASGPEDEAFEDLEFAPEPLSLVHPPPEQAAEQKKEQTPAEPKTKPPEAKTPEPVAPPAAPVSRAKQLLTLEPEPLAGPDDLLFDSERAAAPAEKESPLAPAAALQPPAPVGAPIPPPPSAPPKAQAAAPPTAPSSKAPESLEESVAPMSLNDLMAGMSRDFGSFLGGLPLGMAPGSPAAPPPARPPVGRGVVIEAPGKSPTPPPADRPEMFDGRPGALDELPDSMDAIAHETQVVGETAPPPGQPTARQQPPTPPARPRPAAVPPPPARSVRRPAPQAPVAPAEGMAGFGMPAPAEFGAPAAPRGSKPTSAFDGLAAPAATVDVFSMLPIPGDADPFMAGGRGGVGAAKPPTAKTPTPELETTDLIPGGSGGGDRPAPTRRPPPPQSQQQLPARRAAGAPAAPRPASAVEPPGQNQNIVTNVPPPDGASGDGGSAAAADPKRRKWRFFGSVLLPLLCLGGAGATYAFWPTNTRVRAALRFEGLEKLTLREQAGLFQKVADQLNHSQRVRETALDSLATNNPGVSPGFLDASANPIDFDRVAQSAHADNGKSFLVEFNTHDARADSARAAALLRALYAENKSLADQAATVKGRHERAQRDLDAVQAQVSELEKRRKADADATLQRATATEDERHRFAQARDAERTWLEASRKVHALQDELDTLQAGSATLETDAQVKDLSARLAQLDATLASARGQQGKDTGKAAAAMDLAIADLDKQIDSLQNSGSSGGATGSGDSPLTSFRSAAQAARQQLKFAAAELMNRQQSDDQSLTDLKSRLAEKAQAKLRAVWSADAQLTQLTQRAMVLDRQINTAADSNLPDEAARLRTAALDLKGQIDHRRAELAGTTSGVASAADPEQLKQVDDMMRQMQADQQSGLSRLRDPLQLIASAADLARGDASGSSTAQQALTAAQRAGIDRVLKAAAQVRAAADGYVAAVNSNALPPQFNLPQMEAQRTQLAAQLEARRKQLAAQNADAINSSEDQKAALLRKQQDLATARQLEGRALAARNLARQDLSRAQAVLAQLPQSAGSLAADDQQLAQLQQRRDALGREIEQLAATPIIIPQDPGQFDNNSVLIESPDPRPRLLATSAVLALGLLGSWAFWIYGARLPRPPMAERYARAERQMVEELNEEQALPV